MKGLVEEVMASVKLSKLIDMYELKNCTPDIDISRIKITIPGINRPALQLIGFFEHFDANRVQVIGYVEYSYIEQMGQEEKIKAYDELMSKQFPCIIFCRDMQPDEEIIVAGNKYGVPVLVTEKATSAFTAELVRWLNVELAPCISIHGVLVDVYGDATITVTPSLKSGEKEWYGTGTVISVYNGEELIDDFYLLVEGDVTGDSVCDVLDCMSVELMRKGNATREGVYFMAADTNEDEKVNIDDLQNIANIAKA